MDNRLLPSKFSLGQEATSIKKRGDAQGADVLSAMVTVALAGEPTS